MRKSVLIILLSVLVLPLRAQNVSDLIISEILAEPDGTSLVDDYGRITGWIEIYNTSRGTVKFGGCFITDDRTNLRKSLIPKSDLRTQVGPCQAVVFYASGRGEDGTFYAGITLAPGKTIYLVSNDGRTVIDSLTIPTGLPAGKSVSKFPTDAKGLVYEVAAEPTVPSPGIPNVSGETLSKSEQMKEKDPYGWILTVVSVTVVFAALAILWFLFWFFFDRRARRKAAVSGPTKAKAGSRAGKSPTPEEAAAIALAFDMEESGDTYAAIALALHLHLSDSVHDAEPFTITIRRDAPSAWNDKTQTFRRLPR